MEPIGRKEFMKKAGIAAIGLAAALPFIREKSEPIPRNAQMSFSVNGRNNNQMTIRITAKPKREV